MGRGLGTTQRAMLDHLDSLAPPWTTVAGLAGAVGRSQRQVLAAVRALESRGLVGTERKGLDYDYTGQLLPRKPWPRGGEPVIVHKGEPWPYKPGYVATDDVTFYRTPRTIHGLEVWSVERQRWWQQELTPEKRRELLGR